MLKQKKSIKGSSATQKRKRTTKGNLIKGMSRRLPAEILDSHLFKQRLREIMRHFSGIYALYNKENIYYI